MRSLILAALLVTGSAGCGGDTSGSGDAGTEISDDTPDAAAPAGRCANYAPKRQVFFGDLHVHTALSLDASLEGTRLTPNDAYRFAKGQQVGIQPHDMDGNPLRTLQLDRPLDFAAVTDHVEFLGTVRVCATPGAPGYDHEQCVQIRDDPDAAFVTVNAFLANLQTNIHLPPLCGTDNVNCLEPGLAAWAEIREAAAVHQDSTEACRFTTFVGYEWSGNPGTSNLHRNVIFANASVPDIPKGYFDEPYPEGLWASIRRDCIDAATGCDALLIPHNSNLSTGIMFAETDERGLPLSASRAAEQAALEPLVEILQHKGDSECFPGSPLGDELCNFEKVPYNSLAGANLGLEIPPEARDFVRDALGRGLAYLRQLGVNPWAFGFIAATDTHLGTPGAVSEVGFPGHSGAGISNRDAVAPGLPDSVAFNPGGLAAVWAEENSRESIFAALKRKEAYATSGPRIAVRFFGGFDLDGTSICEASDFAAEGYSGGVPMGGVLGPAQASGGAPVFAVSAARDPGTATSAGTPLQRIQIVKVWHAAGTARSRVVDISPNPDNGASVDPETCAPQGRGADTLCATFTDLEFDPTAPALYYARVLENPTCRWSQRQCLAANVDCTRPETITTGFEGCCDEQFQKVIQERAWTSPIWYVPDGG